MNVDDRIGSSLETFAPILMMFDDRIGQFLQTPLPICRDRGWMGGGLVPVLVATRFVKFRDANMSHPNEDRHKAQYISNKTHRRPLGELCGALGSQQHHHEIRKALLWLKRLGRSRVALLGFVLPIDLLEFAPIDA